jgi:hypothetical protein
MSLMVLLVHLRVLSVGRLRVTVAVTIGTVVCITVGGGILRHAFRKTWALRAILRSSRVARSGRLVPDGRKLRVLRRLTRDTDSLSHLSVDRSFGSATLVGALLNIGAVTLLVGLACGLLLLLLRLPLLADFFELWEVKLASYIMSVKMPR